MKKQIKRKIYLLSKRDLKPIEVIQFETGVQLIFEVQDLELDTTATATLFVRKPSGEFVFQEDNISLTGNTVVIDLHNQAITEYGKPFFQIKFKKDEEVISTYSGMITVEKSLDDAGAEESKTVVAAFDTFTDAEIARIEEATQAQIELMKAEVEAKGESVLATIPEDYTATYNRVNNLFNAVANAIKGTVSGSVVRVDDVSPVEHNPVVKVHGKNLIPFPYKNKDKNIDGITFSVQNNGGIALSGTPTSSFVAFELYTGKPLATKGKIILELLGEFSGVYFRYDIKDSNGTVLEAGGVQSVKTINLDDFPTAAEWNLFIRNVDKLDAFSGIVYPQIRFENTAAEYTPYIEPSTVTVKRCGKNLIPPHIENVQGGYVVKRNIDGSVSVTGSSNTDGAIYLNLSSVTDKHLIMKKGVKYRLTWESSNGRTAYLKVIDSTGTNKWLSASDFSTLYGTDYMTIVQLYVQIGANAASDPNVIGDTSLCGTYRFQIEVGEEATEFEAYTEPIAYTPNTDGTVGGIASVSPTMTLLTDVEGVTIECEYNKDTNKVIEKLTNAVAALGGAV